MWGVRDELFLKAWWVSVGERLSNGCLRENFEAHLNRKWEESAKRTQKSLKYNPGLPPCGDSRYSTLTVTLNDGRLCSQVNGRGATEPERNSKLSVSPSPSNASSNTSLGTPPANTPPEVRPSLTPQPYTERSVPFIVSDAFLISRVWTQTPSRRSACPCSRSKSSHTRSAPTRGPPRWTGPRKTNSSATYRTFHLVHWQIFSEFHN